MSMIDKIKKSFFVNTKAELDAHERVAISNLVSVAKERIWISDPLCCQEYSDENFETDIDNQTIDNIKQSVNIVQNFLEKE